MASMRIGVIGPVISGTEPGERPDTACTTCPRAMWYRTNSQLRAFCREARFISWQNGDRNPIQTCDGREAALADDDERITP